MSDFSTLLPSFTHFPFPHKSVCTSPAITPLQKQWVGLHWVQKLLCVCVCACVSACSQLAPTLWASKGSNKGICVDMCMCSLTTVIFILFLFNPQSFLSPLLSLRKGIYFYKVECSSLRAKIWSTKKINESQGLFPLPRIHCKFLHYVSNTKFIRSYLTHDFSGTHESIYKVYLTVCFH